MTDEIEMLRKLLAATVDIAESRECKECYGPGGTCRCQLLRFISEGQYGLALRELDALDGGGKP